jgi:bis(5'-nucleosyl)-tetraphosphatase (symmetrical)
MKHLAAERGGRDAWLVHGGIRPYWDDLDAVAKDLNHKPRPEEAFFSDDLMFSVFARCCTPEGGFARFAGCPEDCPDGTRPWDDFYEGDDLIVHGHWAMRGHYRSRNVIGLDSGCFYGGKLTAWCQEEDRIVQVPGLGQNR